MVCLWTNVSDKICLLFSTSISSSRLGPQCCLAATNNGATFCLMLSPVDLRFDVSISSAKNQLSCANATCCHNKWVKWVPGAGTGFAPPWLLAPPPPPASSSPLSLSATSWRAPHSRHWSSQTVEVADGFIRWEAPLEREDGPSPTDARFRSAGTVPSERVDEELITVRQLLASDVSRRSACQCHHRQRVGEESMRTLESKEIVSAQLIGQEVTGDLAVLRSLSVRFSFDFSPSISSQQRATPNSRTKLPKSSLTKNMPHPRRKRAPNLGSFRCRNYSTSFLGTYPIKGW